MKPILISRFDDDRVELFRNVRDRDLLGREKIFMAESEMVVRRLMRTPERIHSMLLTPERVESMRDELTVLPEDVPVYVADVELMTEIAGFHIHRGVLAAGRRLHPTRLFLEPALGALRLKVGLLTLLIAERFTNVDNMGAIFRNAAAFGVDGIALNPECCDPLYRKSVRVSMGHVLSIPYGVMHHYPDDLVRVKAEWGCTLVGAEVTTRSKPLWTLPHHDRLAIIFGSEATGLSNQAIEACDAVYQIPMSEAVPSINVATATAVFLYERLRKSINHQESATYENT